MRPRSLPASRRGAIGTEICERLPPGDDTLPDSTWKSSTPLYDKVAAEYDSSFDRPGHRMAWDTLAGEMIEALLPAEPGIVIDVGCGTGRWPARWMARGHEVVGIEQSPAMIEILRERVTGTSFSLIEADMEEAVVPTNSADLVVAMGSLQYARNPAVTLGRFVEWVKPGRPVCVVVDLLLGLVLDLIREGKTDEALIRSRSRRGLLAYSGETADLHLYDRVSLQGDLRAVGLIDVVCRGLLVGVGALGRRACAQAMDAGPEDYLNFERELGANPALADAGLHIIAWGTKTG